MEYVVEFQNVYKYYHVGDSVIRATDDVSFKIKKGEFAVVVGPSGAGKTTILNLLGGMEESDKGKIIVNGSNITYFDEKQLTNYRRNDVGFVFQFYNLMPNLTALENIELASEICKNALKPKDVLIEVGLEERMNNFPSQLSGGEQQRVAIARAIAKNPSLLLCDEPTGALDYQTGKSILKLLYDTSKKTGKAVIVITHNAAITKMADHVLYVKNGKIIKEEYNSSPTPIENIEW
ncbi:MAG: ABC transporter ATP-binding protein [Bacilli bacterium]|nr:ABC transporter ATP-binding protein [Bacilli bacterium]MCI7621833.1 ABC transporter ATP-binding protein [Bacilli bacterium]MDD7374634.1 ABC transporter ATP-binding protein [Bacilli bacterium]MDD7549203.1 ABC transporter ATP-binding protein [Bacilli bacterium]MDD7599048.1 ABC transporter ATP-binding protein [Bacilli bacterium]